MQAKEAIRYALTMSDRAVLDAIDKARDSATTFPTSNGGCHPLWVLGHLALVEGFLPLVLRGEPNAAADWEKHFGQNTEPNADPSAYPSFIEVRRRYTELRDANLKLFDSLSEDDLDKPTAHPVPGLENEFNTYGKSFLTVAMHRTMHRGHVTDAIRAAGRSALAAAS